MPYWFDGNNLIGQSSAAALSRPHTRRAFLLTLGGYRQTGGGRFLVYFDGDDTGRLTPPAGIRVRYSAPQSADDAIAGRLREIRRPAEVIVVSNDRELQSRCRMAGAKTLSWKQFTAKMQARSTRQTAGNGPQEPEVDVEEWMEYFGLKDA